MRPFWATSFRIIWLIDVVAFVTTEIKVWIFYMLLHVSLSNILMMYLLVQCWDGSSANTAASSVRTSTCWSMLMLLLITCRSCCRLELLEPAEVVLGSAGWVLACSTHYSLYLYCSILHLLWWVSQSSHILSQTRGMRHTWHSCLTCAACSDTCMELSVYNL